MIKAKFIGEDYKCDEFHVQKDDIVFMSDDKFNELKQSGEFELIEEINQELPPIIKKGR